jgi:hypothetical protein
VSRPAHHRTPEHTIPLGRKTLRVVDVRQTDPDEPPVLVVEDTSG